MEKIMRKILILYILSCFSTVMADCDKEQLDLCIRGVSLSVTSIDSLRLSSATILNEEHHDDKEETGLAAGDNGSWGLWGNAMTSSFEGNYHFNQTSLAYSAKQSSYTSGLDFFIDSMIFGFSIGYEKTTTKTNFNNGRAVKKGFTIAPYFAYLFNE